MAYLDHAATTPLLPEAMAAMLPYLGDTFGNPSGHYAAGREAQAAVDNARDTVAQCLSARSSEILFTSGGTESINTALVGIAYAMRRAGAGNHVVTTAIEHHAGIHAAQYLEELGFEVTYLGVDHLGRIQMDDFRAALRPETVLASVMLANNEVGTVQPIAEIADAVRRYGEERRHRIILHTDAVQAPGWMELNVAELGVDALSLSSHKFGGPKGSGILYLKRATPFRALLNGGGQEMQKRAGTENVAGIAGTAVALKMACQDIGARRDRVWALRERLRAGILSSIPDARVNGCQENCIPNNLNISFDGLENDVLVERLDARGISTSTGSACSDSTWEPSHVLVAMGIPIRRAVASVRFSLGLETTKTDIDNVLDVMPEEVERARLAAVEAR